MAMYSPAFAVRESLGNNRAGGTDHHCGHVNELSHPGKGKFSASGKGNPAKRAADAHSAGQAFCCLSAPRSRRADLRLALAQDRSSHFHLAPPGAVPAEHHLAHAPPDHGSAQMRFERHLSGHHHPAFRNQVFRYAVQRGWANTELNSRIWRVAPRRCSSLARISSQLSSRSTQICQTEDAMVKNTLRVDLP